MSWQSYVDTNLVGTGLIAKAAILGQQGGVWASTSDLTISTEEQAAIVKGFTNSDGVQANGFRISGQKYFTLAANERTIRGMKGPDGAVLVKTKKAVLVTLFKAPVQAAEVNPIVEGLADYLISVEY